MGLIHSSSSPWSAWPLSSSRLAISARTRIGSPKMRTSGHFSTSLRPSVSCRLEAGDQHGVARVFDIVAQVVQDAALLRTCPRPR